MITQIFIDMDGVLVDYYRSILQHTKSTITYDDWPPGCSDYEHLFRMPYGEVMKNVGSDFWRDMPCTPWMNFLIELISVHPKTMHAERHILTSPPYVHYHEGIEPCHVADSIKGKLEWILKHASDFYGNGNITFSWMKYVAANTDALLIDDSEHNIDSFVEAGGIGLLVPGLHNRRHAEYSRLLEDPEAWLRKEFHELPQQGLTI
jgi:5'(3')-deoxyribonucleotidase